MANTKEIKESFEKTVLQQASFLVNNDPRNTFTEKLAKLTLTQLSTEGMLTVMFDDSEDVEGLLNEIETYLYEERNRMATIGNEDTQNEIKSNMKQWQAEKIAEEREYLESRGVG